MIVWGGIEYIASAASPSARSDANTRIWAALGGLLLALFSFLLLRTINPNLTDFNVGLEKIAPAGGVTDVGVGGGAQGTIDTSQKAQIESALRLALKENLNITINKGACLGGQTTNCTDISGLPEKVYTELTTLRQNCPGCELVITGGSEEAPHKTHGDGKAIIDLRNTSTLLEHIGMSEKGLTHNTQVTKNNIDYIYENQDSEGKPIAPHLHAIIK